MSDSQILKEFKQLPISELVDVQRQFGRKNLPQPFREYWGSKHARACAILKDGPRGPRVMRQAAMLEAITRSIAALNDEPLPRYYSYSDVHILDSYLGPRQDKFQQLRHKALKGMLLLLDDLKRFETNTLGEGGTKHADDVNTRRLSKRPDAIEKALGAVLALLPSEPREEVRWREQPPRFDTLEEYASDPERASALVHFSCFPQTTFHDEVVFLRTIHVSELCFHAIWQCLIETIENVRYPAIQCNALTQAAAFAHLLLLMASMLRTMPPKHFKDFRDATGNASAVQSLNYHRMNIYLRGLSKDKQEVFRKDRHLNQLLNYADPRFRNLRVVLSDPDNEHPAVIEAAQRFDKTMKSWRGSHLALAYEYLGREHHGTGATSGAEYLARFLNEGLFDDTPLDVEGIQGEFADDPAIGATLQKLSAFMGISPSPSRREF